MKSWKRPNHLGYAAPLLVIGIWLAMAYSVQDKIFPNIDILNDFENAHALLHEGAIPKAGSISSFGSYNPPGVSYGLVPGILMGAETPGGANRLAAAFWFSLSVVGLFLYVKKRFGIGPAVVATLIYGVGPPGVFFATSMWPRAHPAFLVWLLYFCDLWFIEKRANALIMVLGLAGFATYWMLEFLPALLVIPVAFLIFRPPVRLHSLAAGSLLFVLIWMPYLHFQWNREFVDLHSLLTRTDIGVELKQDPVGELELSGVKLVSRRPHRWDSYFREYEDAETGPKGFFKEDPRFGKVWVLNKKSEVDGQKGHLFKPNNDPLWYFQSDETLRIHQQKSGWEEEPHPERIARRHSPPTETRIVPQDRLSVVAMGNLRGILNPLLQPIFLWVCAVWLILFHFARRPEEKYARYTGKALSLLFLMVWVYSLYAAIFSGKISLPSLSLFIGTAIGIPLLFMGLAYLKKQKPQKLASLSQSFPQGNIRSLGLLLLFLVIPWIFVGALVWNSGWAGSARRFQWLYVLQATLMGIFLWQGLALLRQTWISWLVITAVIIVVGVNFRSKAEFHRLREGDFLKEGSNKVDIVEWVGAYADRTGRRELSIGYDMPFKQFHLHWHPLDPRYKVGRDFDAQLYYDQGIINKNTSPAGISDSDEIILVDKWSLRDPTNRFWDLRHFKPRKILKENDRWVVLVPQPE